MFSIKRTHLMLSCNRSLISRICCCGIQKIPSERVFIGLPRWHTTYNSVGSSPVSPNRFLLSGFDVSYYLLDFIGALPMTLVCCLIGVFEYLKMKNKICGSADGDKWRGHENCVNCDCVKVPRGATHLFGWPWDALRTQVFPLCPHHLIRINETSDLRLSL